jgi:hypothetical protein
MLFLVDILEGDDTTYDLVICRVDGGCADAEPRAGAVATLLEDLLGVGCFSVEDGAGEGRLMGR